MRTLFPFVVGLACAGCGGQSTYEADGGGAVRECEHLMNVYCTKMIDCAVGAGRISPASRDAEHQACNAAAQQDIPCVRAVAVTASYDECIGELNAATCAPILVALQDGTNPLPATCAGVIVVN